MAAAEVGDAVYDDDATTKRLGAMTAERLGKEAGLFFPTGYSIGPKSGIHFSG